MQPGPYIFSGTPYDSRPYLVHLVFADLSSLHPSSFHDTCICIYITGAAHTVIPIQRQHAHKIAISVYIHVYTLDYIHLYSALETDIEGRCVSLQKAQWKRRHDYPDAEVARRDRARRVFAGDEKLSRL